MLALRPDLSPIDLARQEARHGPKRRFAALRRYVRSRGQTGLVTNCLETSKMTRSGSRGSQDSRIGSYGISNWSSRGQYTLAPENLITLAHFSVYAAMNVPKSAGELANTA